jgi:hypothetical protein
MRNRLHVRVERLRIENTDCRGFFNYQFNGKVFNQILLEIQFSILISNILNYKEKIYRAHGQHYLHC